ncbi:hypothetical protein MIMGU_mgv1a022638mg [Erythranthe guttata]|uniref:ATPase AAA-type core domain-containing protein n=1 Tax=Erythranthe guttata TaxID=4155 RepID=A0A022QFK8_ERYGU|nr:hypothetical protein MIMGU_mgv1a022638mg [Erythranthe guttata]
MANIKMLIETKNKVMQLRHQFSDLPESEQRKLVSKACSEIAVRYNITPTREVDKEIASSGHFPTAEEQEKFKFVSKSLQKSNKIGIAKAVKVIVDALVEMSDSSLELPNLPPRHYMFEGLNHEAKTKLIGCLGYSLGNSFFTYIKLDENYKGGKKEKESLIGKVKKNPCIVVLIDGIEFADDIFYKCLLDISDKDILDDCEGLGVEFWRSIIILTSELGNKRRIASTFFKYRKNDVSIKPMNQNVETKRFRTELLYRLDGMIFFDPFEPEEGDIHFLGIRGGSDMKRSRLLSSVVFRLYEAKT